MKKTLAILAMTLAAAAHADTVLTSSNKAGGSINLTDNTSAACSRQGNGYMVVYSTHPDQNVAPLRGCWKFIDNNVHVLWNDGQGERIFSVDSLVWTDYAERTYGNASKKTGGI